MDSTALDPERLINGPEHPFNLSYVVNQYTGLDFAPINGISPGEILDMLEDSQPVRVVLEPGDATRYEFLLVPLEGQLHHTGGYAHGAIAHIPVNLGRTGKFCAIMLGSHYFRLDFECYSNPHTQDICVLFHNLLSILYQKRELEAQEDAHYDALYDEMQEEGRLYHE